MVHSLSAYPSLLLAQQADFTDTWKSIAGTPYKWGSESPHKGGLDCSGAIYYVLKVNGKPIPRTTARKMYFLLGTEDKHWSKSKETDLIWFTFSNDRPFGHIGMVDSNHTVWQATSSKGVRNTKMSDGNYWDRLFEVTKGLE